MKLCWVSRLIFGLGILNGALFCGRPFLTRLPPYTLFVCSSRNFALFLKFVHPVCHYHSLLFLSGPLHHLFLLGFFMLAMAVRLLV